MRGRVVSLYLMVFIGSAPLGSPLIGFIGEYMGARWALVISGLAAGTGIAVAGLLYARMRKIRLRSIVRRRRS